MQILYGATQKDVNQQFANTNYVVALVRQNVKRSQPAHVNICPHSTANK